jgi:hypothetical protein
MGEETGEHMIRARFSSEPMAAAVLCAMLWRLIFPEKTLGVRAIVADVQLEGLDRSVWHRFQLGSPPHR